jgi:hypothetical protein
MAAAFASLTRASHLPTILATMGATALRTE